MGMTHVLSIGILLKIGFLSLYLNRKGLKRTSQRNFYLVHGITTIKKQLGFNHCHHIADVMTAVLEDRVC